MCNIWSGNVVKLMSDGSNVICYKHVHTNVNK